MSFDVLFTRVMSENVFRIYFDEKLTIMGCNVFRFIKEKKNIMQSINTKKKPLLKHTKEYFSCCTVCLLKIRFSIFMYVLVVQRWLYIFYNFTSYIFFLYFTFLSWNKAPILIYLPVPGHKSYNVVHFFELNPKKSTCSILVARDCQNSTFFVVT